jgi:hypothetical protein
MAQFCRRVECGPLTYISQLPASPNSGTMGSQPIPAGRVRRVSSSGHTVTRCSARSPEMQSVDTSLIKAVGAHVLTGERSWDTVNRLVRPDFKNPHMLVDVHLPPRFIHPEILGLIQRNMQDSLEAHPLIQAAAKSHCVGDRPDHKPIERRRYARLVLEPACWLGEFELLGADLRERTIYRQAALGMAIETSAASRSSDEARPDEAESAVGRLTGGDAGQSRKPPKRGGTGSQRRFRLAV